MTDQAAQQGVTSPVAKIAAYLSHPVHLVWLVGLLVVLVPLALIDPDLFSDRDEVIVGHYVGVIASIGAAIAAGAAVAAVREVKRLRQEQHDQQQALADAAAEFSSMADELRASLAPRDSGQA